jgi:hypothetical protein
MSAGVTEKEMPVRMSQTRTPGVRRESLSGLQRHHAKEPHRQGRDGETDEMVEAFRRVRE